MKGKVTGHGWIVRAYDAQGRLQAESEPVRPLEAAVAKGREWAASAAYVRVTYEFVASGMMWGEHDREPEP